MEHTKGPWIYESTTKTIRSTPTNYWLATMDSWDGAVDNEANARLIAVAPSMYDALAAIANMQTQETTDFRELAALCISIAKIEIAKAEGRS